MARSISQGHDCVLCLVQMVDDLAEDQLQDYELSEEED